MRKLVAFVALSATIAFAACDGFGRAMTAHTDVVARAAGHELKVDQVAAWLEMNPRLPAEPEVVEAIANLWIDYILLATAAAKDSTLASLELDALVKPLVEQEIVWKLRDKVIAVDTDLSDEDLRAQFEQDQMQVRARHILILVPPDATPAVRDSAMKQVRELRARALAGEDFARLATEYSEDPGSAPAGGDLDFFGRGQMVEEFENAVFALDIGEVSDVVETAFGLHLVKLEERRTPDFDEARDMYRNQYRDQAQFEAEDNYIQQLTEPLNIKVQAGAQDIMRELANKPHSNLSGRAASRALVSYKGGAYTAGEFLELIQRSSPAQRAQIAAIPDEHLENILESLTKNEILITEAKRNGLEITKAERDSLQEMTRRQVEAAAVAAGLKGVQPQDGESMAQAINRRVATLLEEIVKDERSVLPVGPITFTLRKQHGAQLFERSYHTVALKVEDRTPPMQFAPGMPQQMPPDMLPPDMEPVR
jgi:hypothetical protein